MNIIGFDYISGLHISVEFTSSNCEFQHIMDLSEYEFLANESAKVLMEAEQQQSSVDNYGFWVEGVLLVTRYLIVVIICHVSAL